MSNSSNTPIMVERAVGTAISAYIAAKETGLRVRYMREQAQISQDVLGAYMGFSRGTIYNIEAGKRAISPRERAMLARGFGCSIATLSVSTNGNGRRTR